jgi:hypothetical protein
MLTEQQLSSIAQLLQRVQISPAEIPMWQNCMQALGQEVELTRQRQNPNQPSPVLSEDRSESPEPDQPE